MLPHTVVKFDATRHICVTDVMFSDTGAMITLTSSKTRQDRHNIDAMPMPKLGSAPVCLVTALKTLLQIFAQSRDSSLFQVHPDVPDTDSYV